MLSVITYQICILFFWRDLAKYDTNKETSFIDSAYSDCRNISIDYGIMEKADNVCVITSDFGWSDLGTWGSLHDQMKKDRKKNVLIGKEVIDL